MSMLANLKGRAQRLKIDVAALYYAARHPLTPWYAKLLIVAIVAYALSPIDLIPDFIPVIGFLDDVVIVPAGILLAVKLIPAELMSEFRDAAASAEDERALGKRGAAVIVFLWA